MSRIFNEQELEALTDEERAGLEDETIVDDNTEVDLGAAAGDNKPATDDEAKLAKEAADAAAAVAEQQAEAAAKESAAETQPVHKPKPLFDTNLPDDIDARMASIKEQKKALSAKFDEGEITVSEYDEQRDTLDDQYQDLREARFKAALAQEAIKSQEVNTWEQSCNEFLAKHPDIAGDELKYNSFDVAVRMTTSDPANAKLSANEMLDKAFARWSSTFGAPVQQEPVKQDKQKPIVPNIGGLPAADTTETDTNRFAALDGLIDSDPLRYQEELFKLSPSERAAYLAC